MGAEMAKVEDPAFDAVREFLGWLDEHPDYQLAQWLRVAEDGVSPRVEPRLIPQQKGIAAILYEYFGVDAAALEQERRALLREVRNAAT